MKVTTKLSLGNKDYIFEADEKDSMESLHQAIVLSDAPTLCDECGNDNPNMFKLITNKDKESNTYVNMHCNKCGANAKLGQYKSSGYFWHSFKKYVKDSK